MSENIVLTEATFYILISLYIPRHGYAIMQNIKKISNDRVNLGPGTLYGALNTIQEKGWIKIADLNKNENKKEYIITDLGKTIVQNEIKRLEKLLFNGKNVINGGNM